MDFRKEIETAINRHSMENGSNTPDFILAEYLADCLLAFDRAVMSREKWYGRTCDREHQTARNCHDEVCTFDELCEASGATGFGPDRLTEDRNIERAVLAKLRSNA